MNRGVLRGIPNADIFPSQTNLTAFNSPTAINIASPQSVQATNNGLAVNGTIWGENAFLGLNFVATQPGGAARIDLRGTGVGSSLLVFVPMSSGDAIGGMNIGGARTAAQLADTAVIQAIATENWNSTSAGSKWEIYTTPNATTTRTLALTLDNDQSATHTNKLTWGSVAFGTKTASYNVTDVANGTSLTLSGSSLTLNGMVYSPALTITGGNLNNNNGHTFGATVTVAQNQTAFSALWQAFNDNSLIQAATGAANLLSGSVNSINSQPTIKVQDANAHTLDSFANFNAAATLTPFNGTGTLTVTTVTAFNASLPNVPTNATVTTMNGLNVKAPTITGTLTTWNGVKIPSVTGAGTNNGILSGSAILVNTAVGIGYTTGAGGTATQLTSKVTAFPTISKSCGTLTWNAAALASDTSVTSASSTNTVIAATDTVIFNHISGGTLGAYTMTCTPGAGSWTLTLRNVHSASLSEAPVFSFSIIKAVTA